MSYKEVMATKITILNASEKFNDVLDLLEVKAQNSLLEIEKHIELPNLEIVISPCSEEYKTESGILCSNDIFYSIYICVRVMLLVFLGSVTKHSPLFQKYSPCSVLIQQVLCIVLTVAYRNFYVKIQGLDFNNRNLRTKRINMRFNCVALWLILPLFLLLSGCAHKELLNDGDDYIVQGQYQLALEKYQKALDVKPKDVKTKQKVAQAQRNFDLWLDQIAAAAIQAEHDNLPAKAQLLYAKLAKHRNTLHYRQKQLQLAKQNADEFGLKVELNNTLPQLNQSYDELAGYISFIDKADGNKRSEISFSVTLSDTRFSTTSNKVSRRKEYISGYETIVNPDYQALQHDIVDLREVIKQTRNDLAVNEKQQQVEYTQLQLLLKDQQITELLLDKAIKNSKEYYRLAGELSELKQGVTSHQNRYNKNQKKLKKQTKKLAKYEHQLDDYFHALGEIPELVDVPLYSDYPYQVTITQQSAKAQMQVTTQRFRQTASQTESSRQYPLIGTYRDESHPAFEQIALQQNPLKLKSKEQLSQILYTVGRKKLRELMTAELDTYQQALINQGNNSAQLSERLENWLLSGIVSQDGFSYQVQTKLNDQLMTEFGHGGYFEFTRLLKQD